MKYIESIELKKKLDANHDVIILDIREPYELEICQIGGLQIPMGQIVERIDEIPKDKEIVVMCKSGRRAIAVANLLKTEHHFEHVTILDGGILSWIDKVDNSLEEY